MNRFIKKLGFNGYFDFQRTFIQEQSMVEETKYRRITKDSYINDIIDTLPLIYQHVFKETQKLTKQMLLLERLIICYNQNKLIFMQMITIILKYKQLL